MSVTPEVPTPSRRSFIEQARRTQIVEAAIETIAELGYTNATFSRIAQRAGISPGLISYHFGGKAELITQVVEHIESAMDAAITAVTEHTETHAAALRAIIETQVHYFAEHISEVLALGQIFTHTSAEPGVADLAAASRRKSLGELEDMFREAQAHGEFRSFAPRPMAVTLLAALETVPSEFFSRPETDVDTYARELADLFEAATRRTARRRR